MCVCGGGGVGDIVDRELVLATYDDLITIYILLLKMPILTL